MTCREQLRKDHHTWSDEYIAHVVSSHCPSTYNYFVNNTLCELPIGTGKCSMCWDQEIIEPKEKENEKMSDDLIEKAYDEKYKHTSASSHMYDIPERTDATKYEPCDLDYKAEYERLSKENENLKCCNELYVKEISVLRERLEQYRFIIKTVEAMCGRDILEDF